MTIGNRIKELRLDKGYTQTELAKLSKLKPAAICQYESGTRRPSYSALNGLSVALTTTADYLLNGEKKICDEEKNILSLFNLLSENEKAHIMKYLQFLVTSKK